MKFTVARAFLLLLDYSFLFFLSPLFYLLFFQNFPKTQSLSHSLKITNLAYSRFVPLILLHFCIGMILQVLLGDQTKTEMSVMFCDIRSFTALSETMTGRDIQVSKCLFKNESVLSSETTRLH